MAIAEHCVRLDTWAQASAPIAPKARQIRRGSRPTLVPSIPPRAAVGRPARRASDVQRAGPRAAPPGWLRVGNAGERNARWAPARRARRNWAASCAELVTGPRRGRTASGQRPARRWTPAPSAAASRVSPATTSTRRRARQIRHRSRPSATRPGSPSWRSTTPARPRGSRATAARGSGRRRSSVNSQSGGRPPRRRPARAQASRRLSIVRRSRLC